MTATTPALMLHVSLCKISPATNQYRHYSVTVSRDLFGTPLLICRWGRLGTQGQRRDGVCTTSAEAEARAAALVAKRRRRGYVDMAPTGKRHERHERRRAVPAVSRRRRSRVAATQLPLWPTSTTAAAPVGTSEQRSVEGLSTELLQAKAEPAARVEPTPESLKPQPAALEQQRQTRIEDLLQALAHRTTRSGAPLQVIRATQLVGDTPLPAPRMADERERLIEAAMGVKPGHWRARFTEG